VPRSWLFVHRVFPGQFVHLARHLAAAGDRVLFITQYEGQAAGIRDFSGIQRIVYRPPRQRATPHPALARAGQGVRNGEAVATIGERLKKTGFDPQLIVGHSGWGEILFLKDVWPGRPLLGYFEFYQRSSGDSARSDLHFPGPAATRRIRTSNAVDLISLDAVDRGLTATHFQRSTYPQRYRTHISVIHEGVDTTVLRPDPHAQVWLSNGVSLTPRDEVVTYSARSLEPRRGFDVFMRALPMILKRRPRAHVLVVGRDQTCYDPRPVSHGSYREQLMAEVGNTIDPGRVHFVGPLPYHRYRAVLQVSSAHVYLSRPFVLSWSLLEAMASGCLIVGSRTLPVEEVVSDGQNGLLADFPDPEGLADRVCDALRHRLRLGSLRSAARQTVLERFDLKRVCLPAQFRLVSRLAGRPGSLAAK
jgi:glycosyltransferase involved in cell wall biosynthesis